MVQMSISCDVNVKNSAFCQKVWGLCLHTAVAKRKQMLQHGCHICEWLIAIVWNELSGPIAISMVHMDWTETHWERVQVPHSIIDCYSGKGRRGKEEPAAAASNSSQKQPMSCSWSSHRRDVPAEVCRNSNQDLCIQGLRCTACRYCRNFCMQIELFCQPNVCSCNVLFCGNSRCLR